MCNIDSDMAGDCRMVGDIDGDGFPDLVVGGMPGENLKWCHYPNWSKVQIAVPDTEFTTDGEVGDVDGDGDLDVITGEHRGTEKVAVWENINNGSSWVEHVVATGSESHLGARVSDLDGDGDMEIVSIAWDDYQFLHLRRNDALLASRIWLPVILNGFEEWF